MEQRDLRIKRLKLAASRRSMLELENLLRPFVEAELNSLTPVQLDAFEDLLDADDMELWEIFQGKRPAPPGLPEGLRKRIPRRPPG